MQPGVIDSLEFARSYQQLRGRVAVAELSRLADSLFETLGELDYTLAGGHDSRQRPQLELKVKGTLALVCQRCLGRLDFTLDVTSTLRVLAAPSGNDSVSDEGADVDELDGVPADPVTSVCSLVEDEVLLALPFAPKHAEGECGLAVDAQPESGKAPFAALGALKRR